MEINERYFGTERYKTPKEAMESLNSVNPTFFSPWAVFEDATPTKGYAVATLRLKQFTPDEITTAAQNIYGLTGFAMTHYNDPLFGWKQSYTVFRTEDYDAYPTAEIAALRASIMTEKLVPKTEAAKALLTEEAKGVEAMASLNPLKLTALDETTIKDVVLPLVTKMMMKGRTKYAVEIWLAEAIVVVPLEGDYRVASLEQLRTQVRTEMPLKTAFRISSSFVFNGVLLFKLARLG